MFLMACYDQGGLILDGSGKQFFHRFLASSSWSASRAMSLMICSNHPVDGSL